MIRLSSVRQQIRVDKCIAQEFVLVRINKKTRWMAWSNPMHKGRSGRLISYDWWQSEPSGWIASTGAGRNVLSLKKSLPGMGGIEHPTRPAFMNGSWWRLKKCILGRISFQWMNGHPTVPSFMSGVGLTRQRDGQRAIVHEWKQIGNRFKQLMHLCKTLM